MIEKRFAEFNATEVITLPTDLNINLSELRRILCKTYTVLCNKKLDMQFYRDEYYSDT
ncbi:hypothetical protein [Leptospira noguchii]|uniref:hypothetical protein n=1 Tax=Leptospira noguchii TaxID=28182 RepID=UPI0012BC2233|nr:hypothetical protein [Leptospira noguchii]